MYVEATRRVTRTDSAYPANKLSTISYFIQFMLEAPDLVVVLEVVEVEAIVSV